MADPVPDAQQPLTQAKLRHVVNVMDSTVQGPIVSDNSGSITYNAQLPPPTVPTALHQLRPPVEDFVGRDDEIAQVVKALNRATLNGGVAAISGIRGLGGIGKTELAYAVAQRLARLFPDAQLVIALRGASQAPLSSAEALRTAIRAFAPLDQLPDELDQLTVTYRSLLQGKRVLLLADDAKDAAQVRPLLPPAGCALLVTSRQRFALDGLQSINLDSLSQSEAVQLVLTICPHLGEQAATLVERCGRLPLALRISASLLQNDQTRSVTRYLAQLHDTHTRLAALRDPEDPTRDVAAVFSVSYNALDPAAQAVLAQLSVFPAPFDRMSVGAIVQLNEVPLDESDLDDVLSLLYCRSLLEYDPSSKCYRLHDLVRAVVAPYLSDPDLVALRHAMHYVVIAGQAGDLYRKGSQQMMEGLALFDMIRPHIDAAWKWLRTQLGPLVDALLIAYSNATVGIGDLRYDKRSERIPQMEAMCQAAQRLGNRQPEGWALGNLGLAYVALGEVQRAIGYYEQQLVIVREIGDRAGEGRALGNLGSAYYTLRDVQRAIGCFEQALAIARKLGDRQDEGSALGNLGNAYSALGGLPQAIDCYEQALAIMREIGDRAGEGRALGNLGHAYGVRGEVLQAIDYFEQALAIMREIGDRAGEARASWHLGLAYRSRGDLYRAVAFMQLRVDFEGEIRHADADKHAALFAQVRQELATQEDVRDRS